nr:hypothetical protein [Tanacetum cinerariifolium]
EHMAWQTDYCIMKEGIPILRGRKSVPGMNSIEREMERGQKPGNIGHKIGSLHQKPDQQAVFHNNQANKAKMSKDRKIKVKPLWSSQTYYIHCVVQSIPRKPTLNVFKGFLNLGPGGDWLTLSKRGEADNLNLFTKPFTNIHSLKGKFFYIQNTIVPDGFPTLLNEKFMGLVLLKVGMDLHRSQLSCDMDKMTFGNFVVFGNDKDVSFIVKTQNEGNFGKGSPSASINNNDIDASPSRPQHAAFGPLTQLVKNTADSHDSHSKENQVVFLGSSRIGDRVRNKKDQAKLGRQPRESSIYQLPPPEPQDKKSQCFLLRL